MSNTIQLAEPTANTLTGLGWTGLRLEKGPNATNLGAFSLVALIPYVFGQTSYTYVDAAGAPSDWYRVARYGPLGLLGTFSPAWPVTPQVTTSGNGTRRSYKNCRRMLARRMGSLEVVTTTADGAIDGTTIISTAMATILDGNRYRAWWAMPTDGVSAGQIRVVGDAALNASSGALTVAPPMTSQIVRGTQVEMHKLLPPEEMSGGLIGLRQALNLALAECWVMDRLALQTQNNAVTYDISSLGDWLDPEAITEYYGPQLSSGIPLYPWGGYAARRQGAVVDLDVAPGLAGGTSTSLELTRPADTLIKIGGVWTDGQQGFLNDTDECLLQPVFLVEVALAHCYEALANSTTGKPQQRYQALAIDQRTRVNHAKFRGLPHPPERADHQNGAYQQNDWMGWIR